MRETLTRALGCGTIGVALAIGVAAFIVGLRVGGWLGALVAFGITFVAGVFLAFGGLWYATGSLRGEAMGQATLIVGLTTAAVCLWVFEMLRGAMEEHSVWHAHVLFGLCVIGLVSLGVWIANRDSS